MYADRSPIGVGRAWRLGGSIPSILSCLRTGLDVRLLPRVATRPGGRLFGAWLGVKTRGEASEEPECPAVALGGTGRVFGRDSDVVVELEVLLSSPHVASRNRLDRLAGRRIDGASPAADPPGGRAYSDRIDP